jgi:hypothetical protein
MADNINLAANILAQQNVGTLMGPPLVGQQFIEGLMTGMTTLEWEVMNGARLDRPLPFGMFVTIVKGNLSKSRLTAHFAPGFFSNAPVFNEVCCKRQEISELICSATVCKKVVPIDSEIYTPAVGEVLWSCVHEPIDEAHVMRTVIKNPVLVAQASSKWDENLNQYVSVSRILTQTYAAPSTTFVGNLATYIYYTAVKCGWWLKQTETFSLTTTIKSYWTTKEHNWAGVLSGIRIDVWDRRDGGHDDVATPIYNKAPYSGPCKVYVYEEFVATSAEPNLTHLHPEPIDIRTPSLSAQIQPTYHAAFPDLVVNVGADHPVYMPATGAWPIAATTPVTWPSSFIEIDSYTPYKGGYLHHAETVYSPP